MNDNLTLLPAWITPRNSEVIINTSWGRFRYLPSRHCLARSSQVIPDLPPPSEDPHLMFRSVNTLWMNVTRDCNLRCNYCFSSPKPTGNTVMTETVARQCVEFLLREGLQEPGQPRKIIFFGGEPLLAFERICDTVFYAGSRLRSLPVRFNYSISTNAALLRPKQIDFLREHDFQIQVSLDGPEPIHDRHRRTVNGNGSWQKTMGGLEMLTRSGLSQRLIIRPTLHADGPDLVELSLFFRKIRPRIVFYKPVSTPSGEMTSDFRDWMKRQWTRLEELVELILRAYEEECSFHPFIKLAHQLLDGVRPVFHCGAGSLALSVEPDGQVYACHKFRDWDEHCLATSLAELEPEERRRFLELRVDTHSVCTDCWARWFCGGCCLAESVGRGGPLGEPNQAWCAFRQFEAVVAMYIAAAFSAENSLKREVG